MLQFGMNNNPAQYVHSRIIKRPGALGPAVERALDAFQPVEDGLFVPLIHAGWRALERELLGPGTQPAFMRSMRLLSNAMDLIAQPAEGEPPVGREDIDRQSKTSPQWYYSEGYFFHSDGRVIHPEGVTPGLGKASLGYGVLGSAMIYVSVDEEAPSGESFAVYTRQKIHEKTSLEDLQSHRVPPKMLSVAADILEYTRGLQDCYPITAPGDDPQHGLVYGMKRYHDMDSLGVDLAQGRHDPRVYSSIPAPFGEREDHPTASVFYDYEYVEASFLRPPGFEKPPLMVATERALVDTFRQERLARAQGEPFAHGDTDAYRRFLRENRGLVQTHRGQGFDVDSVTGEYVIEGNMDALKRKIALALGISASEVDGMKFVAGIIE